MGPARPASVPVAVHQRVHPWLHERVPERARAGCVDDAAPCAGRSRAGHCLGDVRCAHARAGGDAGLRALTRRGAPGGDAVDLACRRGRLRANPRRVDRPVPRRSCAAARAHPALPHAVSDRRARAARAHVPRVLLLDAGEGARPSGTSAALATFPAGGDGDLAEIARASTARSGHAGAAFDRLRPLVGKVVDPTARAHPPGGGVARRDRGQARLRSHRLHGHLAAKREEEDRDGGPREGAGGPREARRDGAHERAAGDAIRRACVGLRARDSAARLRATRGPSRCARNDPDLARWLCRSSRARRSWATRRGRSASSPPRSVVSRQVDGRTIGLVLPTGSNDLRDEAAAIMRGARGRSISRGADPASGDRTKLSRGTTAGSRPRRAHDERARRGRGGGDPGGARSGVGRSRREVG